MAALLPGAQHREDRERNEVANANPTAGASSLELTQNIGDTGAMTSNRRNTRSLQPKLRVKWVIAQPR